MGQTPPLWKISIAVEKARAADVCALLELAPPAPQAVLVAEDPFGPDVVVEALYDVAPDADFFTDLIGAPASVAPLPDQDWIKLSQEGLSPVRAGRFFVYGAHDAGEVPPAVLAIRIEAGMAFGTGHHETTSLCLSALTNLARKRRFQRVLDLGCGTGLLAIGAAKLWRQRVLATDIDPVAIDVTRENAVANGVGPLVHAAVADGLDHPHIRDAAPFDLIIANILAGPLTHLAPSIAANNAPGGVVVLSGLLRWQENLVLSFYRAQGLVWRETLRDGPWSALVLERPGRLD